MTEHEETYIGDGLYASFDGYMITLRAPREHGDHWGRAGAGSLQGVVAICRHSAEDRAAGRTWPWLTLLERARKTSGLSGLPKVTPLATRRPARNGVGTRAIILRCKPNPATASISLLTVSCGAGRRSRGFTMAATASSSAGTLAPWPALSTRRLNLGNISQSLLAAFFLINLVFGELVRINIALESC